MTTWFLPLTERQTAILSYIDKLTTSRGMPPTITELALVAGSSNGSISQIIDRLVAKGMIRRIPRSPRSTVLTKAGIAHLYPDRVASGA